MKLKTEKCHLPFACIISIDQIFLDSKLLKLLLLGGYDHQLILPQYLPSDKRASGLSCNDPNLSIDPKFGQPSLLLSCFEAHLGSDASLVATASVN